MLRRVRRGFPIALAAVLLALSVSPRISRSAESAPPPGCRMKGDEIGGQGLGNPVPAFIRVAPRDGKLREILPMPTVQSDMVQTESLLPTGSSADAWVDVDCSAMNPNGGYGNVSLSGDPCD